LALVPGSRLGVYEITALLGEGGMGRVFRARDTKLNRDVALKVLPESFANDPERLARFTREAQTLAAIYGLEEAAASTGSGQPVVRALVMELVEGEDLSQRIARGAIPLDEALPIAKQIAEALEAAHEQGIIHRDLKPANIKVRADGTAKVLDFGLAKAIAQDLKTPGHQDPKTPRPQDDADAATITTPAMTEAGMILGTAAYMAPEQAKGRPLDKRVDTWAFGAVLYEMLTGQRAFTGEDITDTIVSVLSKEPDWSALPATTPVSIRTLLRRCLEKDRKRRLTDAGAARLEIDEALATPAAGDRRAYPTTDVRQSAPDGQPLNPDPRPRARRSALPWVVAGTLAVALVAALLAWAPWQPVPVLPETRLDIVTPATDQPTSFALSPDGRYIVFVASGDGAARLWLRPLAATTAEPLAGTEGATAPFWAPDSRSIAFFAGNALKRLDLGSGAPQILAPSAGVRGGTWSRDGVIVFAPSDSAGLMRVSATGGAVVPVTTLGPQQQGHWAPHFLPDGRLLFFVAGAAETTGIYLGTLEGSPPTRLTSADSAGAYLTVGALSAAASAEGGWLLWVRAGTLVAQQLDLATTALTGEPLTIADGVAVDERFGMAVSVTAAGQVAYRAGVGRRQLTWVDRAGTARGTVGDTDGGVESSTVSFNGAPRVSPDGRRVVVARTLQGNQDIWLLDGPRMTRLTFDAGRDVLPVWSPDGTRIAFRSSRTGAGDIYLTPTGGAGVDERLVASNESDTPNSWFPDGRFLLYQHTDPQTRTTDLWVVPVAADRTPSVFLKTPFREAYGAFSPDGRWVAYQSNESGRMDVYVRPFVAPGTEGEALRRPSGQPPEAVAAQWQVSTAGGVYPAWRRDGKELYYLNPAGAMMAVPIAVNGASVDPGAPVMLFHTHIAGGGVDAQQGRNYDVAPDGRFLINTVLDDVIAPITLLMNWRPDAKR